MNNKEILNRIICLLLGIIIGIGATAGVWYCREARKFTSASLNETKVEEFNELDIWNKLSYYHENRQHTFYVSYSAVTGAYQVFESMDDDLREYYEKYGWDVVLASGLESGNKLAQVYCIEKICSIAGEEKLSEKVLTEALRNTIIDQELYKEDNKEHEKSEIAKVEKRKALALALLRGTMNSEEILSNGDGTRFAWLVHNDFNGNTVRVRDDDVYFTLKDEVIMDNLEGSEFVSDNCLILQSEYGGQYIVVFGKNITVADIDIELSEYMVENEICDDEFGANVIYGSMHMTNEGKIEGTLICGYSHRGYVESGDEYSFIYNIEKTAVESVQKK